jgi:hypothetical protein
MSREHFSMLPFFGTDVRSCPGEPGWLSYGGRGIAYVSRRQMKRSPDQPKTSLV